MPQNPWRTSAIVGSMAPRGIPWRKWPQSTNVEIRPEQTLADIPLSAMDRVWRKPAMIPVAQPPYSPLAIQGGIEDIPGTPVRGNRTARSPTPQRFSQGAQSEFELPPGFSLEPPKKKGKADEGFELPEGFTLEPPTPPPSDMSAQGAAEAAAARTRTSVRPVGGRQEGMLTRAMEAIPPAIADEANRYGKAAHDLMTGETPPTPENVLPVAAATVAPMLRGGAAGARAARTPRELEVAETGVYSEPRVTGMGPVGQMVGAVLARIPGVRAPLNKAVARSLDELKASGERAASKAIERLGVEPTGGTSFDPTSFVRNYNKLSPKDKGVFFGEPGRPGSLRSHMDALAAVSERSKGWHKFGRQENSRFLRGLMIGGSFMEPLTLLTTVVPGRLTASYLAKPAVAAPLAQWGRAYERFVRSGGAASAYAGFKLATNNLRNSIDDPEVQFTVDDFLQEKE